jgi:hypothetical protein
MKIEEHVERSYKLGMITGKLFVTRYFLKRALEMHGFGEDREVTGYIDDALKELKRIEKIVKQI